MVEQQLKKMGMLPVSVEDSPKSFPFWFEENNVNENRLWLRLQLPTCLCISFVYAVFVFGGQRFMRDRKAFDLQRPLVIWNFCLALFSMGYVLRTLPQFLDDLSRPNGFHVTTCVRTPISETSSFWEYLYVLSKVPELMDTAFIILRKKKLIFLHWFHHMSVIYLTAYIFTEAEPFRRWPAGLNAIVHSFMYTYYGLMALKIKVPKTVAMSITTIQLIQFFTVAILNWYTAAVWVSGGDCYRTSTSIWMHGIVGTVFLILFLKLFYNNYIDKPKNKSD